MHHFREIAFDRAELHATACMTQQGTLTACVPRAGCLPLQLHDWACKSSSIQGICVEMSAPTKGDA